MSSQRHPKVEELCQAACDFALQKNAIANSEEFDQLHKKITQLLAQSWISDSIDGSQLRAALLTNNSAQIKQAFTDLGVNLNDLLDEITVSADWDTFYGSIDPQKKELYLPYPPRPAEVTDGQIIDWVNNTNPQDLDPPYAYLPCSSF
ncbi:MAG: hypothetical protein J7647_09165 [Cyanobacteria bacterium SBLK]|nr:hypothetical protein [Cyanobacteria bacterium SBLK]